MSLIYGKTFIAGNAQCRYDPVAISVIDTNVSSVLSGLSCLSSSMLDLNDSISSVSNQILDLSTTISSSIVGLSDRISALQQTVDMIYSRCLVK